MTAANTPALDFKTKDCTMSPSTICQPLAQQIAACMHFSPDQAAAAADLILWKIFVAEQKRTAGAELVPELA